MTLCRIVCTGVLAHLLTALVPAEAQWTWTPETGRFVNMDSLPKETAELQVEYTRSLVLEGDLKKALNETEKFSKFYPDTEYADDNQFMRGEIKLAQKEYVEAAEEFQQVITIYDSNELYDAVIANQYAIGDTLYEKGRLKIERASEGFKPWQGLNRFNPFKRRPLKKAIEVYGIVTGNQYRSDDAAEAQYKTGLCYFAREEYLEAEFQFRLVKDEHATSNRVQDAHFYLTRSYEEMALEPDYDQAPSKQAIISIAEFLRRYPADARIVDRREVSGEMRERIAEQRYRTAKFYEKRVHLNSARIYYEIVASEFQGTKAAEKAEKWLSENPADGKAHAAFVGPAVVR